RQAILLHAVQASVTDADKSSLAKSLQPTDRQVVRWLRPLGAVSAAFQKLAEGFAGHAAIHDSVHSKQGEGGEGSKPPTGVAIDDDMKAATYLGLTADEVHDRAEHLLAIERSVERFRQALASPDAIRRQIAGNPMAWTQIRYEVLSFASATAAREAADCIRL